MISFVHLCLVVQLTLKWGSKGALHWTLTDNRMPISWSHLRVVFLGRNTKRQRHKFLNINFNVMKLLDMEVWFCLKSLISHCLSINFLIEPLGIKDKLFIDVFDETWFEFFKESVIQLYYFLITPTQIRVEFL